MKVEYLRSTKVIDTNNKIGIENILVKIGKIAPFLTS